MYDSLTLSFGPFCSQFSVAFWAACCAASPHSDHIRRSSYPGESVLTTQPRVPPGRSGTVSTIPLSVHHSRDSSCYSSVIMAHCISCATRLRARRRRHSHREGSRAHLFFGAAFFLAAVCFFGAAFFLAAFCFFVTAFCLAASAFFSAAFFAV